MKVLDLCSSNGFLVDKLLFPEDLSVDLKASKTPRTLLPSSFKFDSFDVSKKPGRGRSLRDCTQRWRGMLVEKLT